MYFLTNERWKSALCIVILPPKYGQNNQFQSVALFVNINGDYDFLPIETSLNYNYTARYDSILVKYYFIQNRLESMDITSCP